jgi:hypothetical protein
LQNHTTRRRIPVKYIRSGIADFVEDTIYMNQTLLEPQWKSLHDKILKHEKAHQEGAYGLKDWTNDMKKASYDFEMLIFMSQNPLSWLQLSPFRTYGRGKLYFDRQLIMTYLGIIITVAVAWTIL